jgi:hypothetical protein
VEDEEGCCCSLRNRADAIPAMMMKPSFLGEEESHVLKENRTCFHFFFLQFKTQEEEEDVEAMHTHQAASQDQ